MVVDALTAVVNEPGHRLPGPAPRGEDRRKTGTAQVIALGKTPGEGGDDLRQRDHAGFASCSGGGSEVAVVVLNEHGGHGD